MIDMYTTEQKACVGCQARVLQLRIYSVYG